MSATVSLKEAGKALGVGAETVAALVRAGHWACIGAGAVQLEGSTKWTYVIPRAGFQRLLAGDIPQVIEVHVHKHVDPEAIGHAVLTAVRAA